MIDYKECTGCGSCFAICPYHAIMMKPDKGGFLRPVIDDSQCVKCGLCDIVCVTANEKSNTNYKSIVALKHRNAEIKKTSTSGGAFRLFADIIINEGGVVYGAAYNTDFSVSHIRCDTIEDIYKLQKSKYVQSDTLLVYDQIAKDIKSGRKVFYSGTACQCSGVLAFAQRKKLDTGLLYTCDVICHGVPSPKIWLDYLDFRKHQIEKIHTVDFRCKKRSWRDFCMEITYNNGKIKTYRQNEDYFMILFFHDYILRESCYTCKFTSLSRKTDITLGDFWGIEEFYPEFDDDLGTSVLLLNTDKSVVLFDSIKDKCEYLNINESELTKRQPNLKYPTNKNYRYDVFWEDYSKKGFLYSIKKYADFTFLGRLKRQYLFKFLYYTGIFGLLLKIKNRNKQ